MRHDKKGDTGRALDLLAVKDIAPGWDKAAGWQKLEDTIYPRRHRLIALRLYPVAAALVMCMLVLRFGNRESYQTVSINHSFLAAGSQKLPLSQSDVVPAKLPASVPVISAKNTGIQMSIRKARYNEVRQSDSVPIATTVLILPAVKQDAPVVAQSKLKSRAAETVYTLNEILANVPEREEPPKRYTGLFRLRAADQPASPATTTRKQNRPQDFEPSAAPPIIN